MKFGELLRALRGSRALSRDELSYLIGINPSYLGEIERGKLPVSRQVLEDLSNFFQVPAMFFVMEEGAIWRYNWAIEEINSILARILADQTIHKSLPDPRAVSSAKIKSRVRRGQRRPV